MESHRLSQLRTKLQALQYKEDLDDSSAPLVDKLVTDLLHTTDSYRDLKLQVATKAQELEDGRNKVCSQHTPDHLMYDYMSQADIHKAGLSSCTGGRADERCRPFG